MRSRARLLAAGATLFALGMVAGSAGGVTLGAFSGTTSNGANGFSAAPDWVAPTASAVVIAKTQGGLTGKIKQGGTYRVYANVSDTGNPPSGTSTVTADVSAISSGQTAASLSSGSFTVGGTSYNYRSASITADNPLTAGSKSYTLASTDAAGNSGTQSGYSATVDNTAPSGSDIQTTNVSGGTVGHAETGDSIVYTFSEQIDPESILAGWTGGSTSVTVQITDGTGPNNDSFTIWNSANSVQLPFGSVDLGRKDYVTASATFTGSAMSQSGSAITVVLGTLSSGTVGTTNQNTAMTWTPSASAFDGAANACTTANVTEGGGADKDF